MSLQPIMIKQYEELFFLLSLDLITGPTLNLFSLFLFMLIILYSYFYNECIRKLKITFNNTNFAMLFSFIIIEEIKYKTING